MNRLFLPGAAVFLGIASATFPVVPESGVQARAVQTQSAIVDAHVERIDAHNVRVTWKGAGKVDVLMAGAPDGMPAAAKLISRRDIDGVVTAAAPVSPRPYFILRDGNGRLVRVAERLLPLGGGQNFRDLGGYQTADGRHVRWGKLYRSGSMTDLTLKDYDYLSQLGVKTICDFRSTRERTAEPTNWQVRNKPVVKSIDYDMDYGQFTSVLNPKTGPVTEEKAKAIFASFYAETPFRFADHYRNMFAQLAAGQVPLAFNCSAGKDRTGVGAALILTALGVPRETVIADYLLSNRYYRPKSNSEAATKMFGQLSPAVAQAMSGVDRQYIEASFKAIETRYGSVDNYLEKALGVTPAQRAALKKSLLI